MASKPMKMYLTSLAKVQRIACFKQLKGLFPLEIVGNKKCQQC